MRAIWHEATAGGHRVVEVTRPEDDPEAPLPTVLSLHGRGDRPHVPTAPFYGIPGPFRYLAPEAPTSLGGGFTWFPVRTAQDREADLAAAVADRAARVWETLEALLARRPAPGGLVITGFSQGAILALGMTLFRPRAVSTVLPSAGWLPASLLAGVDGRLVPPVRALHGDADEAVPVERGRETARALSDAGADVVLETFPGVGHTMSAEMHALKARWLAEAVGRARVAGRVVA